MNLPQPSDSHRPTSPPRRVFLDVLRLIAAVQMIQGHSVDAVLSAAHRSGTAYAVWSFLRGLTSVTFLLTAGLSFVLAEKRADPSRARKRRGRALRLIAMGYVMHAPLGVLVGVPLTQALAGAMVVDVLQCIGASLLVLELLSLRVKRPGARAAVALVLAALCFAAAPLARVPLPLPVLSNYLSSAGGSPFPLLPWAGYVLAGFGIGSLAFSGSRAEEPRASTRDDRDRPALLGAAALACGLASLLAGWLTPGLPAAFSPSYCLLKLGCVLALAALLMRALAGVARLPSVLARLAGQTLFLYVAHVVVLYADRVGLAHRLGQVHAPAVALALALALLVGCAAGALLWPRALRALRGGARSGTRGATP